MCPPTISLDEQPTTKTSPFFSFACSSSSRDPPCGSSCLHSLFERFRSLWSTSVLNSYPSRTLRLTGHAQIHPVLRRAEGKDTAQRLAGRRGGKQRPVRAKALGADAIVRHLEEPVLDGFTQPEGGTPQQGAVGVVFQPGGNAPSGSPPRPCRPSSTASAPGYPGRPAASGAQPLPPATPAPVARPDGDTAQRRQRAAKVGDVAAALAPSAERASPEAPATPPSTRSTARVTGS